MKSIIYLFHLFVLISIHLIEISQSSKILAVFPASAFSHYKTYEPFLLRLSSIGHQLTIISHFPITKSSNIKHINVNGSTPNFKNHFESKIETYHHSLSLLHSVSIAQEDVAKSKAIKDFILTNNEKFDLILFHTFSSRLFLSLTLKFEDAPFILLGSNVLFPFTANNLGIPRNPSYVPCIDSGFHDRMNFQERVINALKVFWLEIWQEFCLGILAARAAKDLISAEEVPDLKNIERRAAMLLVNTHFSYNLPRPLPPNAVEVGGIHIANATKLPPDIEKFLNESEHGVVYFCMGSLLKGSSFPEEKRAAFLHAFDQIPQRVLWKWEGEELPGKTNKIMIRKWMPQRDILAHPNVRLFISHGGLLGTSEAVYEGVPILGIPIFGDQTTNIKAIEAAGAGEMLPYNDISKEVVTEKVKRLLEDPKYRENAKKLSVRYKDRPMSPLDTAVYWTEYVIRHKGAPHLRSAAVELTWYQYLLLDVIAFLLLVFTVALFSIYYTVKFAWNSITGKKVDKIKIII